MFIVAAVAGSPSTVTIVAAAEPTVADLEFYEKQIRPLLTEHCLKCHGPQDTKGNLRIDSRDDWRRYGPRNRAG